MRNLMARATIALLSWQTRLERTMRDQRGALGSGVTQLFGGLLVFVIGLILAGIVIDTGATTGAKANIGSFTGVRSVNDLAPLVFVFAVIVLGLGLMVTGGVSAYKGRRGG